MEKSPLFILLPLLLVAEAFSAPTVNHSEDPVILVKKDIAYTEAGGICKTLIIAYPKELTGLRPAVIHIHGGAWRHGSASEKTAVWLAEEGFIGISIEYRLSQEAIFPAAVHDCKAAVRWARAHAAQYGIDPDRIGLMGGSAGGHLAALLGTFGGDAFLEGDGQWGHFSSQVQAVVDNYGPTDFLRMNDVPGRMDHNSPDSPESQFIGGPIQENPDRVRLANPVTYVDADDPPILLIHGENDQLVIYNQSEILFDALRKAGVKSQLVRVRNAGHGFKPNPGDARIDPDPKAIRDLQIKWLREHLELSTEVRGKR